MNPSLLQRFPIRRGNHPSREDGLCAMEMVAWLAGEEHSDSPSCTSPTIAALVRAFNDRLPDDDTRESYLRPLLARLIGTRGTSAEERRRAWAVADCVARELAPSVLERRGACAKARALRALEEVRDADGARAAGALLEDEGGDALRAARWLLRQAAGTLPAVLWVGGAARVAGHAVEFEALARLLERLVAGKRPVRPGHFAVPASRTVGSTSSRRTGAARSSASRSR